jgi:hypothetical protein
VPIQYESETSSRAPNTKKKRRLESDESRDLDYNNNNSTDVSLEPGQHVAKRKNVTPVRIYYGTRTHAQISQVLRELRKTSYRPVMAVLGLFYSS